MTNVQQVCEYRIWCPECGDKSATWSVDNPSQELIEDSFKQQYEEVTFPTHIDHGAITFIEERHYPLVNVYTSERAVE